jgi:hypothetical protein
MAQNKIKTTIVRPDRIIAKNLTLRESASRLFDILESYREQRLIIDFSRIEFMSRSFADEYLERKEKTSKAIEEKNLPKNVKQMLEIVETSRAHHNNSVLPKVSPSYL